MFIGFLGISLSNTKTCKIIYVLYNCIVFFIHLRGMDEKIYPKVLLCAPQHESKMYCWESWHERLENLTYPNFDIFIADNSDTMDNVNYMNTFEGVVAVYTPDRKKGTLSRINDSHKQCAEYAIKNEYEWVFHLETDVFPPLDVIERLLSRKRPIIAGLYDIEFGYNRKAMVQLKEPVPRTIHGFQVIDYAEHNEPILFNGAVNSVFHAGLGCILINTNILKQVKFRVQKGVNFHTDTLFANDCFQLNKHIFVDTTVQCDHFNQQWLSKEKSIF